MNIKKRKYLFWLCIIILITSDFVLSDFVIPRELCLPEIQAFLF